MLATRPPQSHVTHTKRTREIEPLHQKKQYIIRPVSMSKILGVTHKKLELLKFYVSHASPALVHATGQKDAPWMKSAIQLAKKSPALTAACLTFSQMMLYHLRNEHRYLLEGDVAHPKRLGKPTTRVIGYVPFTNKQEGKLLVMFTEALSKLKTELVELDTTKNHNGVLVACVMVSMCSKALKCIPLLSFEGQGDIFGILRIINDIQTLYLGIDTTHNGGAVNPSRHYLPRDDLLWNIPNLVKNDNKLQICLRREIHQLTELYSMDVEGNSSAHLTAWSVYWNPEFSSYVREKNPYALLLICFYCAYVHRYHGLYWWGDRLQFDLYDVIDQLPRKLKKYTWWPLQQVHEFDYDHASEIGLVV